MSSERVHAPRASGAKVNRPEWLAWRTRGLGGSDIAAICGLSKWSTAFDVWLSKTRPDLVNDEDNDVLATGRRLEPAIAQWAAEETGSVLGSAANCVHHRHDWARASTDGALHKDGGIRGLECKSALVLDEWGEEGTDAIPPYYTTQVWHYAAVTQVPSWTVAVLGLMRREWRLYYLEVDPADSDRLLNFAGEWWHRHVIGDDPPPLDASPSASAWLLDRHPATGATVREADPQEAHFLREYKRACEDAKEADKRKKDAAAKIKGAIGDDKGLMCEEGRVNWSRFERSQTDLKRLKIERPDIADVLDEYTTKQPSGRLSATWSK